MGFMGRVDESVAGLGHRPVTMPEEKYTVANTTESV